MKRSVWVWGWLLCLGSVACSESAPAGTPQGFTPMETSTDDSTADDDGLFGDDTGSGSDGDAPPPVGPCEAVAPSGSLLVSLYTPLNAAAGGIPVLLLAEATPAADGNSVDFVFQPLSTDVDAADETRPARENPRQPVGDPIEAKGVTWDENGQFIMELGEVSVPGEANPISGSVIVATIQLSGRLCGVESMCGELAMALTEPFMADAEGTWGTDVLDETTRPLDISEPTRECTAPSGATPAPTEPNPAGSCEDGVQNGAEGGVDCGGDCDAACPSCDDGVQNQGEAGIDCGGTCDAECPSCWDGVQNQGETGVDCGGECGRCPAPGACNDPDSDACTACVDQRTMCEEACDTVLCNFNPLCSVADCQAECVMPYEMCAGDAPSCDDGVANQGEERVDCGGPCLPCGAWPPTRQDIFTFEGGPQCKLPACDEDGDNGLADTSGTWQRTLRNTRSTCGDAVVGVNAIAGMGAEEVDEMVLQNLYGECERDSAVDPDRHTATVKDGVFASCDFNTRTFDVVSYEVSIMEFDTVAGTGTGVSTVYVTGVPGFLGQDCEFDLEIDYVRL